MTARKTTKKAVKKTPKKMGRPTTYSSKIADEICERLANGSSLRSICKLKSMPSQATIFRWLADERFKDFREQYARAREAQAHFHADEIVELADNALKDKDAIAKARLQIDARKWNAAKQLPEKYGDRHHVEHGADSSLTSLLAKIDGSTRTL